MLIKILEREYVGSIINQHQDILIQNRIPGQWLTSGRFGTGQDCSVLPDGPILPVEADWLISAEDFWSANVLKV